jgi:dUTP pyrophosphatase
LELGYDFYVVADDDFSVIVPDVITPGADGGLFTPEGVRASLIMQPMEAHLFKLGIEAAIEPGYGLFYWDRSGMGGKRQIHRFAGVIDSTYRGEWAVSLCNFSGAPQIIHEGDRIIQGVFAEVINGSWDEVDVLPESTRGRGGFGSSGR